jgi:hypothetical protein
MSHVRMPRPTVLDTNPVIAPTTIRDEHTPVNHPLHYNAHPAGVECIEIIEHMSLNVGNAIKYVWRAGLKPSADHDEDLRKAIWYLERERARLKPQGA